MATRWAIATGNWSDPTKWDGGTTVPQPGDDVHANTWSITLDQDVTVASLRTTAGGSASAGGSFMVTSARTVNANLIGGSSHVIIVNNGGVLTHNGTIQAGSSANACGILINQAGAVLGSHSGDVTGGGGASSQGIQISANCVGPHGPITGTITGGSNANAHGIWIGGGCDGPLVINGNVVSGVGPAIRLANAAWVNNPTMTINGNVNGTGTGTGLLVDANSNANFVINGKLSGVLGVGAVINTTGTITINNPGQDAVAGSINALGSNDYGIQVGGVSCEVTINGNVRGGWSPSASYGLYTPSTIKKITVNGDVIGGAVASLGYGIFINTATVTDGVIVNGTIVGGTNAPGLQINNTTTPVIATCIQGNDFGNGIVTAQAVGVVNAADNGLVRAKQLKTGSHGMSPVQGRVELIEDTPNNLLTFPRYSDMATITMRPTAFSADHPAPANVRHGTVYDSGQKTGTMRVPAAASVFSGVPVDATVGTATVTAESIRAALGMADPDLDAQLAAAAAERNAILAAIVTTNDHTDTVEASIAALPKAIHNFDCGANQGDVVPAVSLRNFVRHVFNWSITDTTKTVYKEDGTTPAYTSTVTIDAGSVLGDNQA